MARATKPATSKNTRATRKPKATLAKKAKGVTTKLKAKAGQALANKPKAAGKTARSAPRAS